MAEQFITVPVYRYSPYATWMLVLYCIATLGLFFLSPQLSSLGVGIYCAILFGLPVYTGLNPRSVFSIRSTDKNPLTIASTFIRHGERSFDIFQVEDLEIYIYSFDGFRHEQMGRGRRVIFMEEGNQNTIRFKYVSETFDYSFYLVDFEHYTILFEIISGWQGKLIPLSARSAFEDDYIRDQMRKYN